MPCVIVLPQSASYKTKFMIEFGVAQEDNPTAPSPLLYVEKSQLPLLIAGFVRAYDFAHIVI